MSKFQTVPHELRLFRRGDFYEAFDKDAEIIGRELEIPVTQTLGANPRPLAGVPYHVIDRHVETLRARGYTVSVLT